MRKRVLLTGIGGFIASHCVKYWLENTDWEIIGIDSFRHKGCQSRLIQVIKEYLSDYPDQESILPDRLKIYSHDLNVPIDSALENLLLGRTVDDRGVITDHPLHYIINMASDSAVERSITDPVHCLRNNYELMVNMLEFTKKNKPQLFIQISTDEVYGEAPPDGPGHQEWDTIMPNNAYSASKAAQEALAIAYWRTYDLPIVITNTMNVVGEMQDPEKFLPKIIRCLMLGEEIPVYADSVPYEQGAWRDESTPGRYWHVGSRVYFDARNKADALKFITTLPVAKYSQGAKRPNRYNICGDTELDNMQIAQMVAGIMQKPLNARFVASDSARPGYDRRYALDGALLSKLGWKRPIAFEETLRRVVQWSIDHTEWVI